MVKCIEREHVIKMLIQVQESWLKPKTLPNQFYMIVLSYFFSSTSAGWLSTNCCCGCISVRSGCIILGWLGVIGGIVGIGGYFFNSNYYIEQLAAHNIPPGWGLAACGKWHGIKLNSLKTLHFHRIFFSYSD